MKSQGQKEINQWEDKDWFSTVLGIWPYPWSVVTHFTTVGSLNPTLTISHSDPDSQDSLFFLQSPTSLDGLEAFGVCGSTVTSPYIAFLAPQTSDLLPLPQRSLPHTSVWVSVITLSNNFSIVLTTFWNVILIYKFICVLSASLYQEANSKKWGFCLAHCCVPSCWTSP